MQDARRLSSSSPGATLVLGGIRSGKSQFAESLLSADRPARYVATGISSPDDAGWAHRIASHRARRPHLWATTEATAVAEVLRTGAATPTLVDDLGGWLTATLDARDAWRRGGTAAADDVTGLLAAIDGFAEQLILVSPEVGLTVVPATSSGRLFADELGALNQAVARRCERVVLVVAGQPLTIKGTP